MDWFAAITELIGCYLVGQKNSWAFLFLLICNVTWVYVSYKRKLWGLFAMMWVFIALNIWNFWKWTR